MKITDYITRQTIELDPDYPVRGSKQPTVVRIQITSLVKENGVYEGRAIYLTPEQFAQLLNSRGSND